QHLLPHLVPATPPRRHGAGCGAARAGGREPGRPARRAPDLRPGRRGVPLAFGPRRPAALAGAARSRAGRGRCPGTLSRRRTPPASPTPNGPAVAGVGETTPVSVPARHVHSL